MGVKHLIKVWEIIEKNPDTYFTSSRLRTLTKFNYYTVMECLDYMNRNDMIVCKTINDTIYYRYLGDLVE